MFPVVALSIAQMLPKRSHPLWASLSHVAAVAGQALWPFITGAIADEHGISAMMPTMLALMGATLATWAAAYPFYARKKQIDTF